MEIILRSWTNSMTLNIFKRLEHYPESGIDKFWAVSARFWPAVVYKDPARTQQPLLWPLASCTCCTCCTLCVGYLTRDIAGQKVRGKKKRRGTMGYPIFRQTIWSFSSYSLRWVVYAGYLQYLKRPLTAGTVLSDSQLLQSCADTADPGRIMSLNAVVCVDALAKGLGGLVFGARWLSTALVRGGWCSRYWSYHRW